MNYKLEIIKETNAAVLIVSGILSAKSAIEIDRFCKETTGNIRIDVKNVTGYETEGARFIKEISKKGVILTGVSPFLSLLIAEQAADSE
jgi:hypothetical protein